MSDTDIQLGDFEGKQVLVTSVAVTNAGDGLSAALGVDPQILHQGDRGAILLEYEVAKVRFEPVKDSYGLNRVHILKASTGTLLDLEEAQDRLDEQRRRIAEAEGQIELPLDGADDGEPQSIGDVLNDAIDLAGQAEQAETWESGRRPELEAKTKKQLTDLAVELGLEIPASATKAEIVESILDEEVPF